MATLARGAGKQLFTCTEGITPIELVERGEKILDPHSWCSPRNAAIYVNTILKAMSNIDPKGKKKYVARAKVYLQMP